VDPVLQKVVEKMASRLEGRRYRLYLFGSRALEAHTPRSDYDLAIWAEPPLDTRRSWPSRSTRPFLRPWPDLKPSFPAWKRKASKCPRFGFATWGAKVRAVEGLF